VLVQLYNLRLYASASASHHPSLSCSDRLLLGFKRSLAIYSSTCFQYLPWGPFPTLNSFLQFLEDGRSDPTVVNFAIFDLTQTDAQGQPSFAGFANYYLASRRTLSVEIGHVIILKPFRRTHVLTHALSLLLAYAFTMPSPQPSALLPRKLGTNIVQGLGLRRVQYTAVQPNLASVNAALRMGFQLEGTLRSWEFPPWKDASCWTRGRPEGELEVADVVKGEGEDRVERGCGVRMTFLGTSWEEWETSVRELVIRQMERSS
jgi:RimJ/RimL family protein N-acetyltransferase